TDHGIDLAMSETPEPPEAPVVPMVMAAEEAGVRTPRPAPMISVSPRIAPMAMAYAARVVDEVMPAIATVAPEAIAEGVEGGIQGGIEGGIRGGVIGARAPRIA